MLRRSCFTFTLLATILVLCPVTALSAQTAPDHSLQKLVLSTPYQANIARLFSSLPPDVFQRCPSLVSNGSTVTVLKAPSFSVDGYPTSGVWKQSFPVSGCGNDTSINFIFFAQSNEKITSMIAAPGDTHADPVLQRDTMRYVIMVAKSQAADCSSPHLRTTQFDGRLNAHEGSINSQTTLGGWRETWTVSACGRSLSVPVTFLTDATGTRIVTAVRPNTGK